MIDYTPPAVAPDWPAADRLNYLAWLAGLALHRIDGDNPTVPLLCKRPVRHLFEVLAAVAGQPAEVLEAYRAQLTKPYNPVNDHHGVHVPAEWLELLAELD